MDTEKRWLKISDVARLTGLKRSSLRYWCAAGVFTRQGVAVCKIMSQWRVDETSFLSWYHGLEMK